MKNVHDQFTPYRNPNRASGEIAAAKQRRDERVARFADTPDTPDVPQAPELADGPIKTAAKRIGMAILAGTVAFGIYEGVSHVVNHPGEGNGLTPTELKAQQTINASDMGHIAAEHRP